MALTKIQPANLDSANDFSSLVTSVFLLANSAYQTANTASTNYFPTGDYGSVVPAAGTLDEETVVTYLQTRHIKLQTLHPPIIFRPEIMVLSYLLQAL